MDDLSNSPRQLSPRRMEIFAGTGQRRWPDEVKAQIVAESFEPDVRVTDVARRHGCRATQVHTWRKAARQGLLRLPAAAEGPVLVPLLPEPPAPMPPDPRSDITVEIAGALVRIIGRPGAAALSEVFTALREAARC